MKQITTGPMQFTPYRPWEEKRRAAASARSRSTRASIIAKQTNRVFDPNNDLNDAEKMILDRLSRMGTAVPPIDVSQANWPSIEVFALLKGFKHLGEVGLVYDLSERFYELPEGEWFKPGWKIIGCGLLRIKVR